MTEAKANRGGNGNVSILPPPVPRQSRKASCAAEGESGTPLARMTRAVMEQTRMVSQNTSKIPQNPCSTGLLAPLHA